MRTATAACRPGRPRTWRTTGIDVPGSTADHRFPTRRRRILVTAVALLALTCSARAAAEAVGATGDSISTRGEVRNGEFTWRTRLLRSGDWGRAAAATAVHPAEQRQFTFAAGLEMENALLGPVRLAGAWRELLGPLDLGPGASAFAAPTRLRLDTGIIPSARRGAQLSPLPGLALAGFTTPGETESEDDAPVVIGLVGALGPLPALSVEGYAAVRSAARTDAPATWVLDAAPFPGRELALVGTRVGVTEGDVASWGSVNLSLGPRLPPAAHARLAARGKFALGELSAMMAIAGREFRSLDGAAPDAPFAWGVQLRGVVGPRQGQVRYRLGARGEAPAAVLHRATAAAAAPHTMDLAVRPSVALGDVTLRGEGTVRASAAGAEPGLGLGVTAGPGSFDVGWRDHRGDHDVRVRGAVAVRPVRVEAGLRFVREQVTSELAAEVRLPRVGVRIKAANLGEPFPDGPRLTVTLSVDS